MKLNVKNITDALKKKKYPFFKGDYNLNLIGVRSADKNANSFNDTLIILFEMDKKPHLYVFSMTTDPGIYYREHPLNVNGTAVLVPGHYKSCWQVGAHQGKYKALVQRGNMDVYRDNDIDADIDTPKHTIERGLFGINLHRAGVNKTSLQVDKWSAGCQVMASPNDFDLVMALVAKSVEKYGQKLSYTLLDEGDL